MLHSQKNEQEQMMTAASYWFKSLFALIRKEWITLFHDPAARRILIVPIIIQSILFGYGATFNLDQVPYAVFDASNGSLSRRLVQKIEAGGIFRPALEARSINDVVQAAADGRVLAGIIIPSDFEDKTALGLPSEVMLLLDARNSTTASVAVGYLSEIVESVNKENGAASPIEVKDRYFYNENNITRWSMLPSMTIGLSMLQVMLLAGLTVAREREEGSFDMMLLTPLSTAQIFIGKAAPPIAVGILQAFLIFLVCALWFEIPVRGSVLDIFIVVAVFSLSLSGIGMAVSAWSSSIQQSMIGAFFIVLPSLVLSGIMTPVSAMPDFLQLITCANPARFAIEMVKRIYLEGAPLSELLGLFIPMIVIAAASIPASMIFFRSRTR